MNPRARSLPAVVASALAAAVVLVSVATAHGPAGGGAGYVSSISGLDPPVVGALVTVLGGDDRLQLVNYSGKEIVVEGYEREPFLRFTPHGVFENARSPTTYLSRVRNEADTILPAAVDATATPVWRKVTDGSTHAWHDRRIRWTGPQPPSVIQEAPNEIHLVSRWRVPARADAQKFAITGFLGYRPLPKTPDGGTSPWLYGLVAAGTVLAAVLIVAGARRARRQAPTP